MYKRQGLPFLQSLEQASGNKLALALLSGIVFNAANILLVAAIAVAGLAVAFPIGIGLALITVSYTHLPRYPMKAPALSNTGLPFDSIHIALPSDSGSEYSKPR